MSATPVTPPVTKVLQFFPATTTAPRALTPEQVATFNREGYLAPLSIYTAAEAAANRDFFDRLMAGAAAVGWDRYSLVNFELCCATIHDLATEPRILALVEDLLGPNFVCFGTHFFNKVPGDLKRVAWHQDAPYYHLSPSKSLTAWLAIDDVDEENAAMRVIPRSHLGGAIHMDPSAAEEQSVLGKTVRDAERFGAPVSINLRAGQISLHSDLLLHGSEPNPSARRRCGVALRYLPVDVRALTTWNQVSIHVRGRDPAGHWAHNPRPVGDFIPFKSTGSVLSATERVPVPASTRPT